MPNTTSENSLDKSTVFLQKYSVFKIQIRRFLKIIIRNKIKSIFVCLFCFKQGYLFDFPKEINKRPVKM